MAEDYVKEETVETPEGIPNPVVKIDNQSDRYHTVVSIQFGDRLGELLDTVCPLLCPKYCYTCPVPRADRTLRCLA